MLLIEKNILKLELQRNAKTTLIWSVVLGVNLFIVILLYPLVAQMMESMIELFEQLDDAGINLADMLESMGGMPANVLEYFATEGALILHLAGGIYAAVIGFSILNKDEKDKVAEVTYIIPVSRNKILSTKLLRVAINLLVFTVVQFVFVQIGFLIVDPDVNHMSLWIFGFFTYLMFLIIAFLSFGVSMFLKPGQSSLAAIAIPFPFYIITIIAGATDNNILNAFKYLSPFTFTEPVGWFKSGYEFELINFLSFVILTIIVLIFSYMRFKKREII